MIQSIFSPFCLGLLLLAASSCSNTPSCYNYALMEADEFVADSYQIKQGKLAILAMEGKEVAEMPCDAMEEYLDVICEDDFLNIVVYHPTRRDLMDAISFIKNSVGGFRVTNGQVDLPDIPPVSIIGLTLEQAREKLQSSYREQIQDIEIFITYMDRRCRKIELVGMALPDSILADGKLRLYGVIGKAHIPPTANLFMSYVMRNGQALPIDLHRLINEGDMSQNIVMRGGDKIYIANPSDCTVMMMGEIGSPRAISLPYGYMSLREALVFAGGIPFTGDKHRIQVIRGNLPCPKIYVLSWQHIVHLPNDSLLLMPGDTVYVSETPITQWNRFIEQLIPSFTGWQIGCNTYRGTYTPIN